MSRARSQGAGRSAPRIEKMCRQLERWREQHGGSGKAIPEALWAEAAAVARSEGVASTARALRLDRYQLARRTEADAEVPVDKGAVDKGAVAGFVELSTQGLCFSARTVLRFEGRDGEQLTLEIDGRATVDVIELARAFWRREQ